MRHRRYATIERPHEKTRSQNDERSCNRNFPRVQFAPIFFNLSDRLLMRIETKIAKLDVQGHDCPAMFACASVRRGRDGSLHTPY